MPAYIRRLTPEGLQEVEYSANSLNDAAQYEPDEGVYTITNTFNTYDVLKIDAHLDRLEDSARRANIPLQLDRTRLRAALREMIGKADYGDVRFRVTVPASQPDTFILSLEPFKPLAAEIYEQGVACITVPGTERDNPAAKTTGWMQSRTSIEQTLLAGVFTGLLLNDNGDILEGLSSNFYAIQNGELRTAGGGVLPGIAQQIVFEVAEGVLPLRRDAVNVRDIPQLEEAFITSASRGIVPVVNIDGHPLGDGTPSTQTRVLRERYLAWVHDHLEPL